MLVRECRRDDLRREVGLPVPGRIAICRRARVWATLVNAAQIPSDAVTSYCATLNHQWASDCPIASRWSFLNNHPCRESCHFR